MHKKSFTPQKTTTVESRIAEIYFKIIHFFKSLRETSRIVTPTILQMEATECGAAALGIILGYYKCYVPLEELRTQCGVSRDGSKAFNMIKAARSYGLKAYGARGEPDNLKQLNFPFIVFWQFNHFVVVEDIQNDWIFINDPALGRRKVSHAEFDTSFTGIILVFEPGPDFKPGGNSPSVLISIKQRLQGSVPAIQFLMLISLTLIVPGIIIPAFSKIFIDDILVHGLTRWLPLLLIGLCLTAVLRSVLSGIQQYHLLRLHMKVMLTSSARFLWHVFRLPIAFFEQRYAGDIQDRVEANDQIASVVSSDVTASVVSSFTLIFYVIVMLFYDWRLTLLGLITSLSNAFILYQISRRLSDSSRLLSQEQGKLTGIVIAGLAAIETIKSSLLDNHFFKRITGNHAKIIQARQKIAIYHQVLSSSTHLLSGLCTALVLGVGSYRIMQGELTVGTLIAFQTLLISFNEPLNSLLNISTKIQEIRGDLARLEDVLNNAEDPRFVNKPPQHSQIKPLASTDVNGEPNVSASQNVIEMRDVSFGYSPFEPPLIQNFSLTLAKGGQIALVGATGSGKSTIAKLLCGLYPPWQGEIFIQGVQLSELEPSHLSKIMASVDQEILLFEGSVADNLTLWDPEIPITDLERACQDALILEVLHSREHLFESHIEANGQNFSGGERQRLEIARALVRNPQLLIIDEGTAALDSMTEQKIMQNLKKRGYSLLMITHRLSTIRDSDEIIVLNNGRIHERGTHETLIALGGMYAEFNHTAS